MTLGIWKGRFMVLELLTSEQKPRAHNFFSCNDLCKLVFSGCTLLLGVHAGGFSVTATPLKPYIF